MIENINTNWKQIIEYYEQENNINFEEFINNETEKYKDVELNIFPKRENIFRCFNYFNIDETKIVLIGQDPYHGPNQATGLCFDINFDENIKMKTPPSLRNICKVLNKENINDLNIENWASQGVLCINSALSVVQGKAGSHLKFWLPFTKYIINYINNNCNNVIFICWGAFAYELCYKLNMKNNNNSMLVCSHPSPLSFTKSLKNYPSFKEANVFEEINNLLDDDNKIIW